jgi:GPH family glycoside/pentoside/hexuronide:cation symporter
MQSNSLPLSKQMVYAFGMMGWSIMINLISVILVYLYAPPADSGFPLLITQVVIFGFFNMIAIITASGRLLDAVYDPLIAQLSDRSKHPKGRRTPFMKWAIIPSFVFCCLVFYPLHHYQSNLNMVWLAFMLIGFYASSTTYIIPYNALLPELAHGSTAKVRLATWQSVGYVVGIGVASNAFNITDALQSNFHLASRLQALQYTVGILALSAAGCMCITAFGIDEKKYSKSVPSSVPMKEALKQTLTNKNFIYFIVADFSYFIAVTIITSGLLYFLRVLLQLPEAMGNKLMITMVGVSFVFYPIVNWLSNKVGKKPIVVVSLLLLALVFGGIYILGTVSIDPVTQIYALIIVAAIPVASLNILPNAILSEVIEEDSKQTGNNKEAIFFAVRYFFVKIAQTVGIALFAMFLIYGKDVGHDFGIRLNGILGFFLCLMAAMVFSRFKERKNK